MMAHGSSSSVVICSRCFGPLLGSYCTRSCCNAAKGTAMHYYAYEFAHSVLSPMRFGVSGLRSMLDWPFNPMANTPYGRHLAAACELFENVTRRYGKPEFGLKTTRIGGVEVGVREQVDRVDAVRQSAALQARRDRAHRQTLRSQGADRGADVGPLRDAAARHRQGDAARPRDLHHRLARRARHPARHGPLRSRRLHRPRHRVHSRARHRHARHWRVSAGGAGACCRGAHGVASTTRASRRR